MNEPMLRLTEPAFQRMRLLIDKHPGMVGLRFGVRKAGCSGWAYVFEEAAVQHEDDLLFEQDGVRVLVDAQSLSLVRGTEIDYVRQGLNTSFLFRNPNVAAECGCGESFTTEAA